MLKTEENVEKKERVPRGTFNDFAATQLGKEKSLTKDQKFAKINEALPTLQKEFGKGILQRLDGRPRKYPHFATGILPLDIALGIGGIPVGRVIEIMGLESSGKSTLTLHIIAEAQKRGKVCAFIDVEHAMDPSYAAKLGVNVDELLFSQPDYGEQALELANKLIQTGGVDIVVIDSVAAMVPKAELAGVVGQAHMGLQARMMGQALRMLTGVCAKNACTLIFINQYRSKIGATKYEDQHTTPGGFALKFFASVRMEIKRVTTIKEEVEGEQLAVSNRVRVRIVKNKMAPPYRNCEFNIEFGVGADPIEYIFSAGVQSEVLIKKGNSYYLEDVNDPTKRLGTSLSESMKALEDPVLRETIRQKVLEKYNFDNDLEELDTRSVSDDMKTIEDELISSNITPIEGGIQSIEIDGETVNVNSETGEIIE